MKINSKQTIGELQSLIGKTGRVANYNRRAPVQIASIEIDADKIFFLVSKPNSKLKHKVNVVKFHLDDEAEVTIVHNESMKILTKKLKKLQGNLRNINKEYQTRLNELLRIQSTTAEIDIESDVYRRFKSISRLKIKLDNEVTNARIRFNRLKSKNKNR